MGGDKSKINVFNGVVVGLVEVVYQYLRQLGGLVEGAGENVLMKKDGKWIRHC